MVSVSTVQPSINLEFPCTYKNLKCLCILYSKIAIIHEKLCMKFIDPWSYHDIF